jgi:hypothetical protein
MGIDNQCSITRTARKISAQRGTLARPVHPLWLVLVLAIAFAIYWATSFILETNKATTRFGADTWHAK